MKKYKDENWLRKNYIEREKTMKEISEISNISVTTIHKWIHKHDISVRDRGTKGEKHPDWKGGKVEVECPICEKVFEVKKYRLEVSDKIFCSYECRYTWQKKNFKGKNNPNWKGKKEQKKICEICGEPYHSYSRNSKFCSYKCQRKWQSKIHSGKNNPMYGIRLCGEENGNWKGGGGSYYGSNWKEQRRKRLKRDSFTCQKCGLSNEENKKLYSKELEVHHKKPIRKFDNDDWGKINNLNNLITLCSKCHSIIENEGDD